ARVRALFDVDDEDLLERIVGVHEADPRARVEVAMICVDLLGGLGELGAGQRAAPPPSEIDIARRPSSSSRTWLPRTSMRATSRRGTRNATRRTPPATGT